MDYRIIKPPSYRPFGEMELPEAKAYFKWFLEHMPYRIKILERAIHSTPTFNSAEWTADKTVLSLRVLGQWFFQVAKLRQRSETEMKEILANLSPRARTMGVPDTTLEEETLSISIDVGMYLGEVFRANLPGTKWKLLTRPKLHIDYHQPILSGFLPGYSCNPVAIAIGIASDYAWKRVDSDELEAQFYIWSRVVASK